MILTPQDDSDRVQRSGKIALEEVCLAGAALCGNHRIKNAVDFDIIVKDTRVFHAHADDRTGKRGFDDGSRPVEPWLCRSSEIKAAVIIDFRIIRSNQCGVA